jgi:Spy/CpxP family protein refolding chaperone
MIEKMGILLFRGGRRMKRIFATTVALVASALSAAAQPAKEPYAPGLGEFMTATQLRHAKLWFAGNEKNWDLAAYEIDEIKEGLEDAEKQFPTHDGIPVADMIKTITSPAIEELEKAVKAKSSARFTVAFDKLTSACNTCHEGANKPFIRIQRPTAPPLSNQNFAPGK